MIRYLKAYLISYSQGYTHSCSNWTDVSSMCPWKC